MRTLLVIISVILLVCWFVSVVFFAVGKLLHMLLILAIITFVISRRKRKRASRHELE
jgi:hypothetical protein